jgi:hypothetical protein
MYLKDMIEAIVVITVKHHHLLLLLNIMLTQVAMLVVLEMHINPMGESLRALITIT